MHLSPNTDIQSSIIGGVIIGTVASSYLVLTGRVTGLSSYIEASIIDRYEGHDKVWRLFYMAGLLTGGAGLAMYLPLSFYHGALVVKPVTVYLAGFLTGFGTRLGNGCTSGHGLMGLARFSPRSLSAVISFMTTGIITASLTRSLTYRDYFYTLNEKGHDNAGHSWLYYGPVIASFTASIVISSLQNRRSMFSGLQSIINGFSDVKIMKDMLIPTLSGLLFAVGLGIGGMANSAKVHEFLDFNGVNGWDYSLVGVLGAGVAMNAVNIAIMRHFNIKTVCDPHCKGLSGKIKVGIVPENTQLDSKILVGSALFGIGWGLTGVCPGPALIGLGGAQGNAAMFFPAMLAGILFQDFCFGPKPCAAGVSTKSA